ncbi:hypothetical protein EVB91_292 [Rhizobium phage RHph_I1_18]|nr:hypothetical protein EVB91_292 [Rhizobium phage RHph_I1_18]
MSDSLALALEFQETLVSYYKKSSTKVSEQAARLLADRKMREVIEKITTESIADVAKYILQLKAEYSKLSEFWDRNGHHVVDDQNKRPGGRHLP